MTPREAIADLIRMAQAITDGNVQQRGSLAVLSGVEEALVAA